MTIMTKTGNGGTKKAAPTGNKAFMEIPRIAHRYRPIAERRNDFAAVELALSGDELKEQASRCMNCGIPFCHGSGCPLGNLIPDFNACVARDDWFGAWWLLNRTSSFPEFTSRVCPALCEGSCCAGPDFGAVSVRQIEKAIIETAFDNGWVLPEIPATRTGRKVAVLGAGPSGLAAAKELNRMGHLVTVYEKNHRPGGLLRYGIPDFKLPKGIVDRRIAIMEKSGIEFVCDTEIGTDVSGSWLAGRYDYIVVATGTPVPRDLKVPGRELGGVHFALDFLRGQNRVNAGELACDAPEYICARGKSVLVVGGGDTGSDCVGTALRQGATNVMQIEIMPKPPATRSKSTPWPQWPYMLRTSSSHEEGCSRMWEVNTLGFEGANGVVKRARTVPVQWTCNEQGRPMSFQTLEEKETPMSCELVLLALGFLRNDRDTQLTRYRLPDDPKIVIVGDAASGPSLVVRAIADARKMCAALK